VRPEDTSRVVDRTVMRTCSWGRPLGAPGRAGGQQVEHGGPLRSHVLPHLDDVHALPPGQGHAQR